jgi:hypothetical protein
VRDNGWQLSQHSNTRPQLTTYFCGLSPLLGNGLSP